MSSAFLEVEIVPTFRPIPSQASGNSPEQTRCGSNRLIKGMIIPLPHVYSIFVATIGEEV